MAKYPDIWSNLERSTAWNRLKEHTDPSHPQYVQDLRHDLRTMVQIVAGQIELERLESQHCSEEQREASERYTDQQYNRLRGWAIAILTALLVSLVALVFNLVVGRFG